MNNDEIIVKTLCLGSSIFWVVNPYFILRSVLSHYLCELRSLSILPANTQISGICDLFSEHHIDTGFSCDGSWALGFMCFVLSYLSSCLLVSNMIVHFRAVCYLCACRQFLSYVDPRALVIFLADVSFTDLADYTDIMQSNVDFLNALDWLEPWQWCFLDCMHIQVHFPKTTSMIFGLETFGMKP